MGAVMSDEELEIPLEDNESLEGAEVLVESGDGDDPNPVEIPELLPVLPLKNTVLFPYLLSPLLVRSERSKLLIDGALLAGGALVHGRPAYRFELSGDGQRQLYFFEDGSPAGYQLRDPLARALVEVRVDFDPKGTVAFPLRVVSDDELQPGGELSPPVYDPLPAEELFRRPGR